MTLWERMHTGHKISALMHGGLILWVLLFGLFSAPSRDRSPPVTDVALISSAEFAALSMPRPAPSDPAPAAPAPEPEPEPQAAPAPAPEPQAAAPITAPPPPAAEVGEETPPQAAVRAPEPTPDASLRPIQRPAERVAPEAVPPPAPDVQTAPREQAALVPDPEAAPSEAPPAQEATAPEAAATETVTEATRIDPEAAPQRTATAPEVSLRPERRPARPTPAPTPPQQTEVARATPPAETPAPTPPQPQQEPRPQPQQQAEPEGPRGDAVMDALAQALSGGGGSPGLSQGEADRLRLRIEECWNVGALSTDALQVVVTIGFEMTPDARPLSGSIRMVDADGGSSSAQARAFEVGSRAILECGADGYGLPSALYDQWREVEITFNPARMSFR